MEKRRNDERSSAPLITVADLLAGAVLPMNVSLTVTLTPGLRHELEDDDPACAHQQAPAIESRFERYTPHVAKWANDNAENAAMLLTNPLAAVASSGAKVSRADQVALEQHLRSVLPTEVVPAGVRLVDVKVQVAEPAARKRVVRPRGKK